MKRTITILTILLIIVYITPNKVFAINDGITSASNIDYGSTESIQELQNATTLENFNSLLEDGSATVTSQNGETQDSKVGQSSSFSFGFAKVASQILIIFPQIINYAMSLATTGGNEVFTIQGTLTNRYKLFDINFFEQSNDNSQNLMNEIKNSVAIWYVSLRNVALIGMVIILIYIGIRMAISTVASEKAKYKQMLTNWLVGLIMLFAIHYVVIFVIKVAELFTNMINKAITNNNNIENIETTIMDNITTNIWTRKGPVDTLLYLVMYIVFTWYEAKFFIMYLSRVVRIYFYMIISPLVCMTYSLDKIKDNRSQAFNAWSREIAMEIFIQPIQLILYIVFLYSAGEIMKTSPFIAILFLAMLGNGEKLIRKLLKVDKGFNKGLSDIKFK